MRDRRLEELLRLPDAHPTAPLDDAQLRAAQAAALTRFAADATARTPRRRPAAWRWLETASVPLALAAVVYAASDWLGSLWTSAESAMQRAPELTRIEPGWLEALGAAMADQPWLVALGALGIALLWLPPVRSALLGSRD